MLFGLINSILIYVLLPFVAILTIFLIIIGFERNNMIWFAFLWKKVIGPTAIPMFFPYKDKLFKDINELKSSDPQLLKENSIRILEVGAGTGPNFHYYPKNCRLITVDKNTYFRETLLENASKFPHVILENAFVVKGEDMRECIEDDYCDVVVLTHILCSADDHIAILKEAFRTLKKGGCLYIFEHVRYREHSSFKVQQFFDPFWSYMFCGCHITRDITEQTLRNIGFDRIDIQYVEVDMRTPYMSWFFWVTQPTIFGKAFK